MAGISQIIELTQAYISSLPVELYTIVGSFLEELIAPIPSPIVLTTAGSLINEHGFSILYVFVVAFIAVFGKFIPTYLYYYAGFMGEEFLQKKFFKFLGLGSLDVDKYGKLIEGSRKGELIFVLLRIIPLFPTAPVSFLAGLINMTRKKFILLTATGLYVRSLILLTLGYIGFAQMDYVLDLLIHWESNLTKVILLFMLVFLSIYVYKNKDRLEDFVLKRFKKS
jgi:membrane protein DedA with SNARE-associated domain